MACTVPVRCPGVRALAGSPRSLAAAFAQMADPRRVARVRYPLGAMLSLAVAAMLSQQRSVLAMAEWGARQSPETLRRLGFPAARTPCQSTRQRLFCKLDGPALAAALRAHFAPAVLSLPHTPGAQGGAVEGKVQHGRLPFQVSGCPLHALTAFCHEHGVVLAHEPITQGEEKSEADLTVAPAQLARIAWPGRVLTGDALFCQRHLCPQVLDAGGDYLLLVKENQPTLYADLQLLFDPAATSAPLPLLDCRTVRSRDHGHGRQEEVRHLVASTDLTGYLDWPGLAPVFRLERTWREHHAPKRALHNGITSLSPQAGPPAQLLALKRGHWAIENRLHYIKDVVLREDASLVHCGQGPTIMALLREAALNLLRRSQVRQISARLPYHSQYPAAAVALLLAPPPTRA